MPTTVTFPLCWVRRYLDSSAAWVFVSSPPTVWRTLILSLRSCCDATSKGEVPSGQNPLAMQSLMLVNWNGNENENGNENCESWFNEGG